MGCPRESDTLRSWSNSAKLDFELIRGAARDRMFSVMKDSPPNQTGSQRKLALLAGIVFEAALVGPFFWSSDSSFPSAAVKVFTLSHYPILRLMDTLSSEDLFVPCVFVMAIIWAVLFFWGSRLFKWLADRLGVSRRQKYFVTAAVAVLTMLLLVWTAMDGLRNKPIPFDQSAKVKPAVEGSLRLALDLYRSLKGQSGNIFFSPYGASTSLGLIHAGARGTTRDEIERTAHFNLPPDDLDRSFGILNARMRSLEHWNRIALASRTSLWCQRKYPFLNAFVNLAGTQYQAELALVDFEGASQAASSQINSWMEKTSHGNARTGVRFNPDTRLVLCSTIYFKGKWDTQFKPNETTPRPFTISTNETVIVPMMYQTAEFRMRYTEGGSAQLLELPYWGKDLSMIIILPSTIDGLGELEDKLDFDELQSWLEGLDSASPHKTHVSLPRFTARAQLDLVKELRALGMPKLFDAGAANLSGIDGQNNLFVSDAKQTSYVEVNEAGTTAVSVTLFTAKSKSMTGSFIANHPFMFLIREKASGAVLFLGRIVDPRG